VNESVFLNKVVCRAGAVGINLTQANCVFMLEPCFNPALESQAIGRVHRLGQKREVHITRLIQEDSVESRILKFLARKFGSGIKNQAKNGESKGEGNEEVGAAGRQSGASGTAIVGNLVNDKADMMIDDFDLLFGAPSSDPIMKMV
jgi:SNF2 family DNA or RNA helicase